MIERGNYIYLTYTDFNKAYPGGQIEEAFQNIHSIMEKRWNDNRRTQGLKQIENDLNNFLKQWKDPTDEFESIIKDINETTLQRVKNGFYKNVVSLNGLEYQADENFQKAQNKIREILDSKEKLRKKDYIEIGNQAESILNMLNGQTDDINKMRANVVQAIEDIKKKTENAYLKAGKKKRSENPYALLRNVINIPFAALKGELGEVITLAALAWSEDIALDFTNKALTKSLTGRDTVTVKNPNKTKTVSAGGNNGSVTMTKTSSATIDVSINFNRQKIPPYRISVKNYRENKNIHLASDMPFDTMLDSYKLTESQKYHIYNLIVQHKGGHFDNSSGTGYDYIEEAYEHIREMAYQQALIGRSQKKSEQANIFIAIIDGKAIVQNTTAMAENLDKQFKISGLRGSRGFMNREKFNSSRNHDLELAWQRSNEVKDRIESMTVSVTQSKV